MDENKAFLIYLLPSNLKIIAWAHKNIYLVVSFLFEYVSFIFLFLILIYMYICAGNWL